MASKDLNWLKTTPIAHRGLHTAEPNVPENSLAAFAAAADAGYAIELDVWLLPDGNLAVFHDTDLARLTGQSGKITEQRAADLAPLRLLGTAEGVSLFPAVLTAVAGRVPLLIEAKATSGTDPRPLIDAVLRDLQNYNGPYAIQSFDAEAVAYLAERAPEVVRGQLSFAPDTWQTDASGRPRPKPDFLAYHWKSLPTPATAALRAQGLPVLAWTVTSPEQRESVAGSADNIIFEGFRA